MSDPHPEEEQEIDIFAQLSPQNRHLIQFAEVGNPEFMVKIGDYFLKGESGFPQSDEFATKYYKLAADYMYEEGLLKYASMLVEGKGIDQDLYLAKRIYASIPKTSKHFEEARDAKFKVSHELLIPVTKIESEGEQNPSSRSYNVGTLDKSGEKVIIAKSAIPLISMDVDLRRYFEIAPAPLFLPYCGEAKIGYERVCLWGPIDRLYTLQDAIYSELADVPNPKFTPTVKSKILFGIAAAMNQIHSYGIWHCDLNPLNIFLNSDLEPSLYNMCYSLQSLKGNNYMEISYDISLGSSMNRIFWSPELLLSVGIQFNPSFDVYSYAMIIYAMFSHYRFIASNGEIMIDPSNASKITLLELKNFLTHTRKVGSHPYERPQGISDPLWKLVVSCWDITEELRPTFSKIVDFLRVSNPPFPGTDVAEYQDYQKKIIRMQEGGTDTPSETS